MDDKSILVANIESLGRRYESEHLGQYDRSRLESNWWEGLKFFFDHSFMRGRRDQLSAAFCQFTIVALEELLRIASDGAEEGYERLRGLVAEFDNTPILKFKQIHRGTKGSSIKHAEFSEEVAAHNLVVRSLTTERPILVEFPGEKKVKKTGRLTNDEDLMMVLDVLKLISCPERQNIYCHLKDLLCQPNGPETAYKELTNLRAVGDKIATFVIRDIGILNPGLVEGDNFRFAFPVDTWVSKLAKKLGCEKTDVEAVKIYLIEECCRYNRNPLLFAVGLWYMGFFALEILLDHCLNTVVLPVGESAGKKP